MPKQSLPLIMIQVIVIFVEGWSLLGGNAGVDALGLCHVLKGRLAFFLGTKCWPSLACSFKQLS